MFKHISLFLSFCFCTSLSWGQTYAGPNNPNTQANIALTGIVSWVNPTNAKTNNGSYATVTDGLSTYLSSTDFGFSIPAGNTIKGIKVEVDRKGAPQHVVAVSSWDTHTETNYSSGTVTSSYGTTSYTYSMPVAAGNMRLLVVTIGIENVDKTATIDPTVTLGAVKYAGVTMTLAGTVSLTSSDTYTNNMVAVYYLTEASLPLLTGNNALTITKTINGETSGTVNVGEYTEIVGVNTFTYVDQTNPISTVTKANTGTSITSPSLADNRAGDYIVAATMNNTPTSAGGDVTAGSYSELFQVSNTNTGSGASGAILEAQGGLTAAGSPSITVSATGASASRLNMVAVSIHAARVYDNSVKIIKGGSMVGNDYAVTPESLPNAWPDQDTYEVYGGPTDLWGTTWTLADINATNFGVAFKADADNSIGSVDQVRITVYYDVALAVALQSFVLEENDGQIISSLSYNTDDRNEYTFVLERAGSDLQFSPVSSVTITGNNGIQNLSIVDLQPNADFSYYRIKMVEQDGVSSPTYSTIQNVKLNISSQVELYPNPATSYLEIISNDLIHSVSLLDVTGKTISLQQERTGVKTLKIETLPAKGLYTIVINTGSGITVKKIIID
ncbi:MAG TPA: T9SS type A sorting domain-containing protein [Cytophagaceae bacterium]|nr:T9SS type A sorting domain-containing protein [Cytophagaceae bacterium]